MPTAVVPYYTAPPSQHVQSKLSQVESLLSQLEDCSLSHEYHASILRDALTTWDPTTTSSSSAEWNAPTAIRCVEWLLLILRKECKRSNEEDQSFLAMALLYVANCMHQWDDCITYAACVYLVDGNDSDSSLLQQQQQQHDNGSRTFLHTLQVQLVSWLQQQVPSPPSRRKDEEVAALMVITTAWDTLARLDRLVGCGAATTTMATATHGSISHADTPSSALVSSWWMPPANVDWDPIVSWVLSTVRAHLNRTDNTTESPSWSHECPVLHACRLQPEQFKATCASHLTQLIQNGYSTRWTYHPSSDFLHDEMRGLLAEAKRLSDPDMPFSSYTLLSLSSLHLFLALQTFLDDVTTSDSISCLHEIVDYLVYAAFGTAVGPDHRHERVPRWAVCVPTLTCKPSHSVIQTIVSSSSVKLQRTSLTRAIESHSVVGACAEACWKVLLLNDHHAAVDRDCLDCLVLLHQNFRIRVRECLEAFISHSGRDDTSLPETCQTAIRRLLHCARHQCSLSALALLRLLLSDRRSIITHDTVSRCMWERVDIALVQDCWDLLMTVCAQSTVSDHARPNLLSLLDIVHMIVSTDTKICHSLLLSLSAQNIETLIHVMSPTESRIEKIDGDVTLNMSYNLLDEVDESTPTVHNLSRLGDTSVCVDDRRIDRGMDASIRLSSATLLAALGSCPMEDNIYDSRAVLVQARIGDAVNSFVAETQLSLTQWEPRPIHCSFDLTRRRLRLIKTHAVAANEDFLAEILFASEQGHTRQLWELQTERDRALQQLQERLDKEKELIFEKDTRIRRLNAEATILQREKCVWHQRIVQEAKKMVEIHQAERSRAMKVADDFSTQCKAAQLQLIDSKEVAESCRKSEAEARSMLEQATRRNQELESREQSLYRRLESSESEMTKLTSELKSLRDSHDEVARKEREARALLEENEKSLEDAENSERALQESLEALFADMVSLARLYEMKEKEVLSAREGTDGMIQNLKRKLDVEQKQKAQMEEKLRQLQYENEVLSQKYAKTREKLESEREERRHDADRFKRTGGPVSYINQLHRSMAADNDSRQESHGKENKPYSSSRSGSDNHSRVKHH